MKLKQLFFFFIMSFTTCSIFGQDMALYQQFNGRYDFTFIGNTLNTIENNSIDGEPEPPCTILTSSSATLNLNTSDVIQKAYMYWAGSGTGDFEVKLNNQNIIAQRTFSIQNSSGVPFFSAFADVTTLIQTTGNGVYTFSEMDLSNIIANYCNFGGNFGGWALVIVYKNNALPLNQLNVYDGMDSVPSAINITLNSLNVIDNQDAKIGFVAWEGDKNISVNESLRINGNLIGNPPLNPSNNAFNGTNSFTNSDVLYNMDLDVYDIQNNIQIGDTTAEIQLTSNQDFVMINVIVTKLNSQLPDATIVIDNTTLTCNSRQIDIDFTVSNLNATNPIPMGTPIAIYANGQFITATFTSVIIPIDGSISDQISILIPDEIPNEFELKMVVDDDGTGNGIVIEIEEDNNSDMILVALWVSPGFNTLENLVSCNEGLGKGTFNFSNYSELVKINPEDTVLFFESYEDALANTNSIINTSNYVALTTPKEIFVRINNEHCYSITSFMLITNNCPPIVYNFVSANNDTKNDTFYIGGLRDVFMNFQLSVFNRWGKLIWTGNNNTPDWDGYATYGLIIGSSQVPNGTYYYLLDLNDPDYKEPLVGFLYFTK